jgi:hypothetical protein
VASVTAFVTELIAWRGSIGLRDSSYRMPTFRSRDSALIQNIERGVIFVVITALTLGGGLYLLSGSARLWRTVALVSAACGIVYILGAIGRYLDERVKTKRIERRKAARRGGDV